MWGALGAEHVDAVEDAPVRPLPDRDRVPVAGAFRVSGEESADDELQGVGGDCHRERTLLSHGSTFPRKVVLEVPVDVGASAGTALDE
jgi:hypothetical protein